MLCAANVQPPTTVLIAEYLGRIQLNQTNDENDAINIFISQGFFYSFGQNWAVIFELNGIIQLCVLKMFLLSGLPSPLT